MTSYLILIILTATMQAGVPLDEAIVRIVDTLKTDARAEKEALVSNTLVFYVDRATALVKEQADMDIDANRLTQALRRSGYALANPGDWRRCNIKRVRQETENCAVVGNAMYFQIDSVAVTGRRASVVVTRHHTVRADAGETRIAVTQLRVITSYSGTEWAIEEMITIRRYNLNALAVGEPQT